MYRVVSGHLVADPTALRSPVLAFLPEGLALVVDGVDPVGLPWDLFRGPFETTPSGEESWRIEHWAHGRHGDVGIAVQIAGPLAGRALAVDAATGTWLRRMNRRFTGKATREPGPGSRGFAHIPIVTVGLGIGVRARRDQLRALCGFVRDDEAARSRLADARRVEALARALDACRLAAPDWNSSSQIDRALWELAGRAEVRWPYLRPLPGEQAPDANGARLALERARTGAGTELKDRVLDRYVERMLDVEPWPFEALRPNFVDLT